MSSKVYGAWGSELSLIHIFSSVEDWFKGVDLAPKEKVPAEPGNEMKFPACKAAEMCIRDSPCTLSV